MKKKKTILLVSDDAAISELELSLKQSGYNVITEVSGDRAVASFETNRKIDIVLIDPYMKGSPSGTETGLAIQSERRAPVLFISDKVEPEMLDKALNAANCGFTTKSSDISVLDASIRMAMKCFTVNKMLINETELQASKEKYKKLSSEFEAILDHIPALVFYKDKNNRFIRVNRFLAAAHKKNKVELEGVSLYDLYPKDEADKYFHDDLDVINSGIAKMNIEEPWNTEEGMRWVNTSRIPFLDEKGEAAGLIGISADITEKKMAEQYILKQIEEINRLNEFYHTVFDSVSDWIVVVNSDYEAVFSNMRFNKLFTPDDSGISMAQAGDVIKSWRLDKLLHDVFEKGVSKETEIAVTDSSAWSCFYSISISPVFSDVMSVDYAVIRGKDITSSLQQMDEIIRMKDLLDSITHNAPVGIVITDSDGVISFVNRTFEILSDYGLADVLGEHISFVIKQIPSFNEDLINEKEQLFDNLSDYELYRRDGDILPVKLRVTTIEKPVDKNKEIMFFITDISFERKLELKQIRLQNNLESIMREMDELNELLLETDVYNQSIKRGAMEFESADRRIIRYVEAGLTNKEIADKLGMAEVTIKKRLSGIYAKLGIKNKYQLLEYLHKIYIPDK